MEALNTAWAAASEDMYKATQGAENNGTADAGAEGAGAENVQDVDFEEVK
jgi:molecular chaperone DnaK